MKTVLFVSLFLVYAFLSANSEKAINEITQKNEATDENKNAETPTKLNIKYYYETLCPYCRNFETDFFREILEKLSNYLDIQTYPYGNVYVSKVDNKTISECQHGPEECYGNKLHACALDIIKNHTAALLYNNCMMDRSQEDRGSDDKAADKCGTIMGVNSTAIKKCAQGERGTELFDHYGNETRIANIFGVPNIWINGTKYERTLDVFGDICAYFVNTIPPCAISRVNKSEEND